MEPTDLDPQDTHEDLDTSRIVKRFKAARPLIVRKSDDPFTSTWRSLVRFTGTDAASRVFDLRDGQNVENLQDVRNCIRLADSFYDSYVNADDVIDPALMYYGSMWLACAVIYADGSSEEVASLRNRPHHGVTTTFAPAAKRIFLDARVDLLAAKTAQIFASVLGGDVIAGQSLKMLDILRLLPELDDILREVTGAGTRAIPVWKTNFSGFENEAFRKLYPRSVSISFGSFEEDLDGEGFANEVAVMDALVDRELVIAEHSKTCMWTTRGFDEQDLRTLCIATSDALYLERVMPSGHYLPELAAHLIVLHALSDLVRYHPNEWIRMVDDHTDEYSIIREFITVSERKYPNLILNELTRTTYVFEHS